MAQASSHDNYMLEYVIIAIAGVLVLWAGMAESVALVAGGHKLLPDLSSALKGLYGLLSRGNPVSGWSEADRHDLPSAPTFLAIAGLELVGLFALGWAAKERGLLHKRHDTSSRAPSRADIKSHLGLSAVRERTAHLRSDIDAWKVPGEHVGFLLGVETTTKEGVWTAGDDSVLIIGPPGSGKTVSIIIPAIVDAPGAVVATSTRDEIVEKTAEYRMAQGHPAWVFAPQMDSVDIPGVKTLQWSPLQGCEHHLTAVARATSLVKGGAGFGSSTTNADFWEQSGVAVVRCYLMAAAVGGKTMEDVLDWSTAPNSSVPVALLQPYAPAWARELQRMGEGSPATVSSVWAGVRRSFDCFADPRVLKACSQGTNFDIDEFLSAKGTAYLIGSGSQQMSLAPLISALVEAINEKARQPQGRGNLTTPMSLILDEAANIAPLPTLPSLLSDGGGSGIQVMVVLQSLAQARHRWSPAELDAMWDASTIKVVLPGMSHAQDLEAISKLCGEIEEIRTSKTTGAGGSSASTAPEMKPAWTPEQIRGLKTGHALVLHRRLKPVEVITKPYWEREKSWNK